MYDAFALVTVALLASANVCLLLLLRRGSSRQAIADLERGQDRVICSVADEFARNREEGLRASMLLRQEVGRSVDSLADQNSRRLAEMRCLVDERLRGIQEENGRRVEEIRRAVDERLQGTLERRLGESFRLVSERLAQVHRGLGEMHALAAGVGDLKRVLTNVKTRGVWGEVQLESLLADVLAPEQYAKNVAVRSGSRERVDFAIRLPGARDGQGDAAAGAVLLPIDAKFPLEDYQRLVHARDVGDALAAERAARKLETTLRTFARDVRSKYICPPTTTDFALLFLPTEGLYAEVLRRPGLAESVQRETRVVVTGPSNFAALVNSLQMGFRTLAIQKRTSEIWEILGTVTTQFGEFTGLLESIQERLRQASATVERATRKSRTIERRLTSVESLSGTEGASSPESPPPDDKCSASDASSDVHSVRIDLQ